MIAFVLELLTLQTAPCERHTEQVTQLARQAREATSQRG